MSSPAPDTAEREAPAAAPSPQPQKRTGFFEWIWRGRALREARAFRTSLPRDERTYIGHALLAAELADRAYDPIDPLRNGSGLALSISLYREAAYWALRAHNPSITGHTLAEAFASAPTALLEHAAGNALPDVKRALVERSFVETAGLAAEELPLEAASARSFSHALIAHKLAPERRVGRVLLQRAVRSFGLLAILAGFVAGGVLVTKRVNRAPDIALGKPWRASSTLEKCKPAEHYCASAKTDIFFHTVEEQEPWVEIDLGKPTRFSVVDITNRTDCCPDRAVPIVIEVGNDQAAWHKVASRKETFTEWHAQFAPQTARYVRVRSTRRTVFHLEKVAVRDH